MWRKTSPATAQLVSLSAVKRQCRVESSEYDALINVYLSAAIDYVEREAAVSLAPATFEQRFESFGGEGILTLETGPIRDVESIKYLDVDEVEQTISTNDYDLEGTATGGFIWFRDTFTTPYLADAPGAVRVTYNAGFNDPDASPGDDSLNVPNSAKLAVLILTAHWYDNRTPVSDVQSFEVPMTVQALIDKFRVYR